MVPITLVQLPSFVAYYNIRYVWKHIVAAMITILYYIIILYNLWLHAINNGNKFVNASCTY